MYAIAPMYAIHPPCSLAACTSLPCFDAFASPHSSICQAMETSTLTQQRKNAVLECLRRPKPRDAIGNLISHSQLRDLEKAFTNRVYFEGTPFVPWNPIQARVGKRRGWNEFRHRFQEHIYLPRVDLQDCTTPPIDFATPVNVSGGRKFAVHRRPHVTGVFYDPPGCHGVGRIYVLHCGLAPSSNQNSSHGPDFTLKIGRSQDIFRRLNQHQRSKSPLSQLGVVEFLFGVEIDTCYQVPAESLIKDLLTEFGFIHLNEGQSTENRKSLPLIHDIVCAIRFVYNPPIKRVIDDKKDSVENPLLEQGLPRELQTSVETLMEFLSARPGWNTMEGGGSGSLTRLPDWSARLGLQAEPHSSICQEMPTSTEKQSRLETFRAVTTRHHRDPQHVGVKLSAKLLRILEMPFVGSNNLYYHKAIPYVSWRALQSKLGKSRALDQFAPHFGGVGLIVDRGIGKLKTLCTCGDYQLGGNTSYHL